MRKYGFSLTRTLPYKDIIFDSVLIRRIRVSQNPYSRTFFAVYVIKGLLNLSSTHILIYSHNCKQHVFDICQKPFGFCFSLTSGTNKLSKSA